MAKTYGDLILEYENFEYSKENYDLTKECYELQLMSQYLECQQFASNDMIDIRNEFNEFNESYFLEDEDGNTVETLSDATEEKSKNIFIRLWEGIKKIWASIKGFFSRIFNKFKKTTESNSELFDNFDSADFEFTEEEVDDKNPNNENRKYDVDKVRNNSIGAILNKAWKQQYKDDGYVIANNQPFANNIKSKLKGFKGNKYIFDMLAVAMADTEVVISLTSDKKILTIFDLEHVFDEILSINDNPNSVNNKKINNIKKFINTNVKDIKQKGISIKVDNDNIDDAINKLNDINSKMQTFMNESASNGTDSFTEGVISKINKFANKYGKNNIKNGDYKNNAAAVSALKDIYSDLTQISANMMKLYTYLQNYRSDAGRAIAPFIKKTNKN